VALAAVAAVKVGPPAVVMGVMADVQAALVAAAAPVWTMAAEEAMVGPG